MGLMREKKRINYLDSYPPSEADLEKLWVPGQRRNYLETPCPDFLNEVNKSSFFRQKIGGILTRFRK
jgi:hypothetical protein